MGRAWLKKTASSQKIDNGSSENIDSSTCKKKNLRQVKEKLNCSVRNSLRVKDCNRIILSDKTAPTLNQLNSNQTNILPTTGVVESKPTKTKSRSKKITFNVPTSNGKNIVFPKCNDNVISNKENNHFVPIYKQNHSPIFHNNEDALPPDKLALYEFDEVDPEEPVSVKKKRKKQNSTRKRNFKTGSKYLTINNIKYGSNESIDSVKDPPTYKKPFVSALCHRNRKNAVKRQSQSTISLNDTQSSCVSIAASFKSLPVLENSYITNQLSVINEVNEASQLSVINEVNEASQLSVINEINKTSQLDVINDINKASCSEENIYNHKDTVNNLSTKCDTVLTSVSDNQSWYNDNVDNTFVLEQTSQCNIEDVCSSTLCTHRADSDSDSEFYGFEDNQHESKQTGNNFYFDFNEDEGIEEPLLSPIKKLGDENVCSTNKVPEVTNMPVLSVREIVQMLQAEQKKNESDCRSTICETPSNTPRHEDSTSIVEPTEDSSVSFNKPPRRSYERPLRRRFFVAKDYVESSEDEEEVIQKTSKPPLKRKYKAKESKQEAEANKLAEMINSKFQEIDKFSLCVE